MTMLEGRLISEPSYKSDDPLMLKFELTNYGNQNLYVLTWYRPLEGLFSNCLKVLRDGERVAYDGPLVKRGTPTAEDYMLVPAGQAVSRVFELSRTYEVSVQGTYEVALDTKIDDFFPPHQLSA
jgi:hypothetical protein